jgi:isopenicillin N synthase-like dioxygenase
MYVQTINFASPTLGKELVEALTTTGFAVLEKHPVPHALLEEVLGEWQGFFASPTKMDYLASLDKWGKFKHHHGLFPYLLENAKHTSEKNLLEYFHYYKHLGLPAGLSAASSTLYDHLWAMSTQITGLLQIHSPAHVKAKFPSPLPEMIKDSQDTVMRFLHYPPLEKEHHGKQRNIAHEDIGLFTLLPIATQPGLQVLDKQGNWHNVACEPTTIVINAGDMLQHTSDHYFRSTTHRVVTPKGGEDKPRYSLTMFVHPRRECFLAEGVTAEAFLKQRLQDNGVYPKTDE